MNTESLLIPSWGTTPFASWIKEALAAQTEPQVGSDLQQTLNRILTAAPGDEDMEIAGKELALLAAWITPILSLQEKEDENSDLCQITLEILRIAGYSNEDMKRACVCYG
ncbi:hypothetical protein ACFC0K_16015 [Streptomyces hydrogenans]|uniref:hypothetical protein n=1 Tax=Streptomyces hydrogenans TaxID=1873719 RepID=UPI0035DADC35